MIQGAVDTKEEAKSQTGSLISYLFGQKSIEKKLKNISLFDNFDAKSTLQRLQNTETQFAANKDAWLEYFSQLNDGTSWQVEFVQNNDLSKVSLEQLEKAQNAARQSAIAYNNSLKQMTIGAKAGQIAFKGLSTAVNAVIFSLAITAVSKFLGWLGDLANAEERAQEKLQEMSGKAQEAKNTIKSLSDEMKTQADSVNSIKERYAELAQGVDTFSNKNLSLSTAEYEEFLDLTNKLAEAFPQLNIGIDENGNALLNLKGSADSITGSLQNLLEAEQALSKQQILENVQQYANNAAPLLLEQKGKYDALSEDENYQKDLKKLESIMGKSSIGYGVGDSDINNVNVYESALSTIGIKPRWEQNKDYTWTQMEFTAEEQKKIKQYYADFVTAHENEVNASKALLDKQNAELSANISHWVDDTLSTYESISTDSSLTAAVNAIVGNTNWSELIPKGEKDVYGFMQQWILENIITPVNNADGDVKHAFEQLFGSEDLPLDKTTALLSQLQAYFRQNQIDIDLNFLVAGIQADSNTLKNRLGYDRAANSAYDAKHNAEIDSFVNSLSSKDRNLLIEAELPEDVQQYTAQQLEQLLENLKKQAANGSIDIPAELTSYLSANQDLKDKLTGLSQAGRLDTATLSAMAEYDALLEACGGDAEKLEECLRAVAKASAGTLGANNELTGISGGLDSLMEVYNQAMGEGFVESGALSSLYEQFGDLSIFSDFAEAMQNIGDANHDTAKSFDDLLNAYLDSQLSLDSLTDATKKQYIQQLKQKGVANAEEVIEKRLAAMTSLRTEAVSELSGIQQYAQTTTGDLENATADEISMMIAAAAAAGQSADALNALLLQKQGVTLSRIDETNSIEQLISLAQTAGLSAASLATLQQIKENHISDAATVEKILNETKESIKKQLGSFTISYRPTGSTKPKTGGAGGSGSAAKSSETFNWLETRLSRIRAKLDKWLNQAGQSAGLVSKYYSKAEGSMKKLLETESKAYARYQKAADQSGLSSYYKKRIQEGALSIQTIKGSRYYDSKGNSIDAASYKKLSKKDKKGYTGGEALIQSIQKYQDNYEKAREALESFTEASDQLANAPLDKAAQKIEKFGESIDSLDLKLSNAIGYSEQNKIIESQKKEQKKQLKAYKTAAEESGSYVKSSKKSLTNTLDTKKERTAAGITEQQYKKIKAAMKAGTEVDLTYFKEGTKAWEAAVKYNDAVQADMKATQDLADAQEEYNRWLAEAEKQKFDNITTHYEQNQQQLNETVSAINRQIDETEAAGAAIDKSFYEAKQAANAKVKKQLEEQLEKLQEQLPFIKKGTAEWYDAREEIESVKDSISGCVTETYALNDAIRELETKTYEDTNTRLDDIVSEYQFLLELADHTKSINPDNAQFTDYGIARLGVAELTRTTRATQAENDRQEIQKLQAMLSSGDYGIYNSAENIKEQLDFLYGNWQKHIQDTYKAEQELADLQKQKLQSQLDLMQELINAKKESLSAEKDLHSYQKNISGQVKSITTLEKQLQAVGGDTSLEGRARAQKLQKELDNAKEALRETEYDKYISDQEAILDAFASEYENLITRQMDDFKGLVTQGIEQANANADNITDVLNEIQTTHNYSARFADMINGWNYICGEGGTNALLAATLAALLQDSKSASQSQTPDGSQQENPTKTMPDIFAAHRNANGKVNFGSMPIGAKMAITPAEDKAATMPTVETAFEINAGTKQAQAGTALAKKETLAGLANNSLPDQATFPAVLQDFTALAKQPNLQPVQSVQTVGDVAFNFALPNVQNTGQLLHELQTNQKVQQAIQKTVINPLMGKSVLETRSIH